MSSLKRKCPFSSTSPQQFKTHITLKEAAKLNNDLLREMMDKTRNLLVEGQQGYWNSNSPPPPAVVPAPLQCFSCKSGDPSRSCHHCARYSCTPCSRVCVGCEEVFCSLCSVLNYDTPQTRESCLSCEA